MMPRLSHSEGRRRGPAAVDDEANRELFAPVRRLRDIIVLIDTDVLTEWTTPADPAVVRVDPRVLLSRLLTDPHVGLYRYADDGPPSTVEPTREAWGTTLYEGWAVVTDRHPDEHLWQVVLPTKEGFSLSAVVATRPTWPRMIRRATPIENSERISPARVGVPTRSQRWSRSRP